MTEKQSSTTTKVIWAVVLFAVLAVALAIALVTTTGTDKAGAATRTCVGDRCITASLVLIGQGPTLHGAEAVAGDPEALAAYRRPCGQANKAHYWVRTDGITGRIRTSHYSLGWCYKNGHITWVGKMKVWGDMGDAGRAAGLHWKNGGEIGRNWFKWGSNNHADGGFASLGVAVYEICFETPFVGGKVCPITKQDFGKILVYSDGHSRFFNPNLCEVTGVTCRRK